MGRGYIAATEPGQPAPEGDWLPGRSFCDHAGWRKASGSEPSLYLQLAIVAGSYFRHTEEHAYQQFSRGRYGRQKPEPTGSLGA